MRRRFASVLILLLLFAACGGGESKGKLDGKKPGISRDTKARLLEGAKTSGGSKWPSEPVEFPVADFEPVQRIDAGSVSVQTEDGSVGKLSEHLRSRTLLVFMDPNTKDKDNRASARFLRKVIKGGRALGFRTVVLFSQGTTPQEAKEWFKARQVREPKVGLVDHAGQFAKTSGWEVRSAGLVDAEGNVATMMPRSDNWRGRLGHEPAMTADVLFQAWAVPDDGPEVAPATRQAAVDLVAGALAAAKAGGDVEASKVAAVQGSNEHGVWVTLFRPGTTVQPRGSSEVKELGAAVLEAAKGAIGTMGARQQEWLDSDDVRIQIDVAGARYALPTRELRSLWFLVEPGIDGLVLTDGGGRDFVMLPGDPVTAGLLSPRVRGRTPKLEKMLGTLASRADMGRSDWKKDSVPLQRFRATTFGRVTGKGKAVTMVRGNVPLPARNLTEPEILDSLRLGGLWLANTVQDDGKFDYEYYPNQDKGSSGYNIVRHAGSVYGLFEMYELAGQEKALGKDRDVYIEKASRAMGYIYEALEAPRGAPEDRVCLIDQKRCESGSAALTLLTFLVRPEEKGVPSKYRSKIFRKDDEKLIKGLGLTLVDMIDDRGKVFRRYAESVKNKRVKKEPLYYPGEAMLALVRLHERDGDERWLNAARKIADRQVKSYTRDRFQVPDHWVMQAFYRLWRLTKDDSYAKTAYKMADHYCSEQYPVSWTPFPDYLGSWRRTNDTPRTTRAGSRSEALRAVMHLAWERGDKAEKYENALQWAARHLTEQQFTERNGYWLPDPKRVEGAYPMGVVDNHVRIDNNQHALVGIVGALEAARKR